MSADRFVRIRVGDMASPGISPGARLRLEFDPEWGDAMLSDENVLPERVDDPEAHRIESIASIPLSRADVEWLVHALGELAQRMAAHEAESSR